MVDSGGTDQKKTVDWVNGKDFHFSYMGTSSHTIGGCSLEYIQVWEAIHIHAYEPNVIAPACTERGYTTYTCPCGDSYRGDYIDATGHSYVNGVCALCKAKEVSTFQILDKRCDMVEVFAYEVGMTWREWLNSEYNTGMGSCIAIWVSAGPNFLGSNPHMDIFVNGKCADYDDLICEEDHLMLIKYQ